MKFIAVKDSLFKTPVFCMQNIYVSILKHRCFETAVRIYFRFLSVRLNRLKNKLLANYLRNRGNDLATVRNSAFCVAILSNNSFICKYNIFSRKYELSVEILYLQLAKKENHSSHSWGIMLGALSALSFCKSS